SAVTTYYYQVSAYNGSGSSANSSSASATTPVGLPPLAPSSLAVTATTATSISLSWADNTSNDPAQEEDFFKLYWSTDGVSYSWGWTTGTNVTTLNATGLTGGTTYSFYVKATNANGDSAASNTVSAATTAGPAAPSNLAATVASAYEIDLSWTSNSGG